MAASDLEDPTAGLRLAVMASEAACMPQALALAAELQLDVVTPVDTGEHRCVLVVTPAGLELRQPGRGRPGPVRAELVSGAAGRRLRQASAAGELLARAVGLPSGTRQVVDATAGLGGDASVLAALGCSVLAIERSPVVAALLRDGLRRAHANPVVGLRLGDRLTLVQRDARDVLHEQAAGTVERRPDAVLIDPMYPADRRTAAARKEMQLFRRLVGEDDDAPALLACARAVARRRVVVKRPLRAPPLDGQHPDVTFEGRSTRFDVYLAARS